MPNDFPAADALTDLLRAAPDEAPAATVRRLAGAGFDRPPLLPFPATGATLARWQVLAAVGAHDLAVAKLFEGHTDALAILHEAAMQAPAAGSVLGTWCAEPPDARLQLLRDGDAYLVDGRKSWCSGARSVSHAVVSCWNEAGQAVLALVDLRQDGIAFDDDGWRAVGMRDSASIDVYFARVAAIPVGAPGFYVDRPGFWVGGAGVAACWFGAAVRLADALHGQLTARPGDAHRLAQLGEVAIALHASAALMREVAQAIDREPRRNAMAAALSVRLSVEAAASVTLAAVGRALGAGPLCKDAAIARLFADLPVFMRQSHAERDLEAVGKLVATLEDAPWTL